MGIVGPASRPVYTRFKYNKISSVLQSYLPVLSTGSAKSVGASRRVRTTGRRARLQSGHAVRKTAVVVVVGGAHLSVLGNYATAETRRACRTTVDVPYG